MIKQGIMSLVYKDSIFKLKDVVRFEIQKPLEIMAPLLSSSSEFLLFRQEDGKEKLYSSNFRVISNYDYSNLRVVSSNLIIAALGDKFGVIDSLKKIILPFKYDGIVYQDGVFSLLSNGKFGMYDPSTKLLLPAKFEKLVKIYDRVKVSFYTSIAGRNVFLDQRGKTISQGFDQVNYWNSDTALVKMDSKFALYSISAKKNVYGPFETYDYISKENKTIKIYQNRRYGVFTEKRGEIIAVKYNDLINLGTAEKPFYFAEHHIEEADFYVVLHLNSEGKVVRTQPYKADEYEKILCDE